MRALEPWILAYLLNSLWQIPLVFCAAWAAACVARRAGPQLEHRVWVCALLLEVALPACAFRLGPLSQQAWNLVLWLRTGGAVNGMTRIVPGPVRATEVALSWLPPTALMGIVVAYAASVVYFAGRLARGAWRTAALRRSALDAESAERVRRAIGPREVKAGGNVTMATSSGVSGPAMVGALRQTLLLPTGFLQTLSEEDLKALLGHEMAHARRRDFAKNLLYGVISLPGAYHPLLLLTRARLAETRELVCDAMAAETVGGEGIYARSLLRIAEILCRFAGEREGGIAHAVGIFDADNFERRIMQLTHGRMPVGGARRGMIAAACVVLGFSTCVSAMAWRMEVTAPEQKTPKSIAVDQKNLKLAHVVNPVYPPEAKAAHVEGQVVLALRIGKDGTVAALHTISGPAALQTSAMDAVRQWRYEPYLLNGSPIEVKTQVSVIFELQK